MDDSRRKLEALRSVAAGTHSLYQSSEAQLRSEVSQHKSSVINRSYDATPMFLKFGRVPDLHLDARYLQKVIEDGRVRWITISYEQWCTDNPKLRTPHMGVLEIGLTKINVCFGGFDARQPISMRSFSGRKQDFVCPPCAMKRTTASCIYSAVDAASPAFNLQSLTKWCEETGGVAILNDCPDNVAANGRCKKAIAKGLPGAVLFDCFSGCCVHKLHNIITHASGEVRLAGHVHACARVLHVTSRRQQLQDAARHLIEKELSIVAGVPPPEYKDHLEELLSKTALVTTRVHRASIDERGESLAPIHRHKALEAMVAQLPAMINGDIRKPKVEHYCNGCCQDESGVTTREQQVCSPLKGGGEGGGGGGGEGEKEGDENPPAPPDRGGRARLEEIYRGGTLEPLVDRSQGGPCSVSVSTCIGINDL